MIQKILLMYIKKYTNYKKRGGSMNIRSKFRRILDEINIDKIVLILILITPIIDLINGFFDYVLKSEFSPGVIIRAVILMILILIFLLQNKKNIIKIGVCLILFIIQMILISFEYHIELFSEISFISKIYYNILMIYILNNMFKNKIRSISKYINTLVYVNIICTSSIIISRILNIGVNSYGSDGGFKGLFIGLNDITSTLVVTFPFVIYKAINESNKKEKIFYLIFSLISGINIVLIGTKTAIAMFFLTIAFFIYNFIKNKGSKRNLIVLGTCVLIFLIIFRVFYWETFNNTIIERMKFFFKELDFFTFLVSKRNLTLMDALPLWASKFKYIVFGVGFTQGSDFIGTFLKNHGMIEMDIFDILYFYGIIMLPIIIIPTFKVLYKSIKIFLKNEMFIEKLLSLVYIINFTIMFLGGHVLLSPLAGIYFAVLYAIVNNMELSKRKIPILEKIKRTILKDRYIFDNRTKVYNFGPSIYLKGGIATVIRQIYESKEINREFKIYNISTVYNNKIKDYFKALIKAIFITQGSIAHIHMASDGSFYRKAIIAFILRNRSKIIIHIHGGNFYDFYLKSNPFVKILIEQVLELADNIVTVSHGLAEDIKRINVSNKEIKVIYNSISKPDSKIDFTNKENKLLFMGKLESYKGIYDSLKAIKNIKDELISNGWKLLIAGDGDVHSIKVLIKEYKIEDIVEVLGWIDGNYKREILGKTKVLIMPSYIESFGISCVEAMSYGNAVIVSNIGGLPEIVDNNINGIIISPGDIEALGNAILSLIKNEDIMINYYKNNIEKSKNFYEKNMINEILKLYKSLET